MTDWNERMHASLLAKRVPRDEIELGVAYRIHARNGGIGVALIDEEKGMLGYRLRRTKFDRVYLFTEWDWEDSGMFGTAIPLERLEARPPEDDGELLNWLEEQEALHAEANKAAWDVVLSATGLPR